MKFIYIVTLRCIILSYLYECPYDGIQRPARIKMTTKVHVLVFIACVLRSLETKAVYENVDYNVSLCNY